MKKVVYILIVSVFCRCNTGKLFKEYTLYHRDNSINYPKENLTIKFINDTTGLFINIDENSKEFNQRFVFSRVKNDYLIIENVNQTNLHLITLKQGDTIVVNRKRLHFFYNDDKKYLLSFKKM